MVSKDFMLGLIAGEGTFSVSKKTSDGECYLAPYFQFRVSGIDEEIVRDMKESFGDIGTINVAEYDQDYGPMVNWRVENKRECVELSDNIQEEAPSGWWVTEKGKNFNIWLDIVSIYAGGQTTPEQRIEMAKLAKGRLNNSARNAKSEEEWNKLISIFKQQREREPIFCGSTDTVSGEPCEQRVSNKGDTCRAH